MTTRQGEILAYIKEFAGSQGVSPTVRDIMARFGFKSPNGVMCHLHALERKGKVRRIHGIARGLLVVDETEKEVIAVLREVSQCRLRVDLLRRVEALLKTLVANAGLGNGLAKPDTANPAPPDRPELSLATKNGRSA